MKRILLSEHRVTTRTNGASALPKTWATVLEFVALFEAMPDSEWRQRASELRQLADEIVRETAELPRPIPAALQRFLDRCAAT